MADSNPIVVYEGNTSPAVTDELVGATDNQPINLSGKTVRFRMRPFTSGALAVDSAATIVNMSLGMIRYDWAADGSDTSEPGSYWAWWVISQGSLVQDTPEFEIVIDAHTPGLGTTTGAIAEGVKLFIPETISAMTRDRKFSDYHLQKTVDDMKMKLFATVVDAAAEVTAYSAPVIDHVSKLVTLRLIPAGVDFWNNTLASQAATGTSEQSVYLDRRKGLWDIAKRLDGEVAKTGISVGPDGVFVLAQRPARSSPAVSYSQPNALSPDPLDVDPPYGPPCPPKTFPLSRRTPNRVYP